MKRYKELYKTKILNPINLRPLGLIDTIIIDKFDFKTSYLILKNNNLVNNKLIIAFKDLVFIDEDRALCVGFNMLNYQEKKRLRELRIKIIDKEIRNDLGDFIGYIKDIVFDLNSGMIIGFLVSEGLFEEIIRGMKYIPATDNYSFGDNFIQEN